MTSGVHMVWYDWFTFVYAFDMNTNSYHKDNLQKLIFSLFKSTGKRLNGTDSGILHIRKSELNFRFLAYMKYLPHFLQIYWL